MSTKIKRFTLELGEEGEVALEEIRVATGTSSKSEVLRDALALYELLVDGARDGNCLYVGPDRANVSELVMPSLKRAAKQRMRADRD